jgi:hypothetical protein
MCWVTNQHTVFCFNAFISAVYVNDDIIWVWMYEVQLILIMECELGYADL